MFFIYNRFNENIRDIQCQNQNESVVMDIQQESTIDIQHNSPKSTKSTKSTRCTSPRR